MLLGMMLAPFQMRMEGGIGRMERREDAEFLMTGTERRKKEAREKMFIERKLCHSLGKYRFGEGGDQVRKKIWLIPYKGMWDFVSGEDNVLGLM